MNRDFVLYSQPVGIIHLLRWHNQQEPMSSPMMKIGGEVKRGVGEGTVYITHGHTLRACYVHGRRMLGALETHSALVQHAHMRCIFAGHALEACWVCAQCALGVR